MKILFRLDQDEGIDPNDPIGDIMIRNDRTLLSIKSTYLDSWFDVLIDGYKSLLNQKEVTLELVEEPETITFKPVLKGFKFSYGKQELFFSDLSEFHQCLLTSTQDFLAQLEQDEENLFNLPNLIKIYHFSQQAAMKKQENLLVS